MWIIVYIDDMLFLVETREKAQEARLVLVPVQLIEFLGSDDQYQVDESDQSC